MGNKKIKYIPIVILVIIVAGIIIWRQNKQKEEFSAIPTPTPALMPSPAAEEIIDWAAYQKKEYSFEIKYPDDFIKEEWTNFIFTNVADEVGGFFLIQLKIPSSYIKSKFYSPDIRVEVDDKNICDKLDRFAEVSKDLAAKEPLAIGSIIFVKREKEAANPGVSYDKIIYYTKNKEKCYSITLFNIISTAGIETLADQNKIGEEQNQIEKEKKNFIEFLEQKMLPTFKFLE